MENFNIFEQKKGDAFLVNNVEINIWKTFCMRHLKNSIERSPGRSSTNNLKTAVTDKRLEYNFPAVNYLTKPNISECLEETPIFEEINFPSGLRFFFTYSG